MKRLIISILLTVQMAEAQEMTTILSNIEANNMQLKALRQQTDAEKTEAHTGITPQDPTVGVNYLWGSPKDMESNRLDLSLTQEFDFPTAYSYRRKMADGLANEAEISYLAQRREVLSEAVETCIELAYCQEMEKLLKGRMDTADKANNSTKKKYDNGEATIWEMNKTKIEACNIKKEYELNNIEIERLRSMLANLNGGTPIETSLTLDAEDLPQNFDEWYAIVSVNCPEIKLAIQQTETATANVKLQKAQRLPHMSIGYMSERTSETTLQGVAMEISIPLYEKKNTTRSARQKQLAAEAQQAAIEQRVKIELKSQYDKARELISIAQEVAVIGNTANVTAQLEKAIESGEIDILHYCEEMDSYYEFMVQVLSTKRDAAIAIAMVRLNEL